MVEKTLSTKEKFAFRWLVQKKWIPSVQKYLAEFTNQNSGSIVFLEWLYARQILSSDQFSEAIQEYHQTVEFFCNTCQKTFLGKFAPKIKCAKCTTPLVPPSQNFKVDELIGQVMGGCILTRKLGQGGMGAVYLAFHTRLKKWVALKILPTVIQGIPNEKERFILEARSGSQLEHPNIIGVLDVGESNNCLYMIQQYIEGESLSDLISKRGKLPIEEALPILKGICEGLYHAHKNKIIHRDIKPDNIMLSNEGEIKIADFGLAKSLNSLSSVSVTGTILGTPHFMSPEQCDGRENLNHRSDIYSLGITLFQMLTGKLPFEIGLSNNASPMTILFRHVNDPVPNPLDIDKEFNPLLAQLLMKALAKSPEDRFQDCQELLSFLEMFEKGNLTTAHFPTIPIKIPVNSKQKKIKIVAAISAILLIVMLLVSFQNKGPGLNPIEEKIKTIYALKEPQNISELKVLCQELEEFQALTPEEFSWQQISFHLEIVMKKAITPLLIQHAKETAKRKQEVAYVREQIEHCQRVHQKIVDFQILVPKKPKQLWHYLDWENQLIEVINNKEKSIETKIKLLKEIEKRRPPNPNNEVLPPKVLIALRNIKEKSLVQENEAELFSALETRELDLFYSTMKKIKSQNPSWEVNEKLKQQMKRAIISQTDLFEQKVFSLIDEKKEAGARFLIEQMWEALPQWPTTQLSKKRLQKFLAPKTPAYGDYYFKVHLKNSQSFLVQYHRAGTEIKANGVFKRYKNVQSSIRKQIKLILNASPSSETALTLIKAILETEFPDFSLISDCAYYWNLPYDSYHVKNKKFVRTESYQKILLYQSMLQETEKLLETFRQEARKQKSFRREIWPATPIWNTKLVWFSSVKRQKQQNHFFMLTPESIDEILKEKILNTKEEQESYYYRLVCFAILRNKQTFAKKISTTPQNQSLPKTKAIFIALIEKRGIVLSELENPKTEEKDSKEEEKLPYLIRENILSEEELDIVWKFLAASQHMFISTAFDGHPEIRSSHVLTIESLPIFELLLPKLMPVLQEGISYFNITAPLNWIQMEYQCTRSGEGEYYRAHRDRAPDEIEEVPTLFKKSKKKKKKKLKKHITVKDPHFRAITYVYYFHKPDVFTGGELWMEPEHNLQMPHNSLIVFDSTSLHAVKVTHCKDDSIWLNGRWTLNGWVSEYKLENEEFLGKKLQEIKDEAEDLKSVPDENIKKPSEKTEKLVEPPKPELIHTSNEPIYRRRSRRNLNAFLEK